MEARGHIPENRLGVNDTLQSRADWFPSRCHQPVSNDPTMLPLTCSDARSNAAGPP